MKNQSNVSMSNAQPEQDVSDDDNYAAYDDDDEEIDKGDSPIRTSSIREVDDEHTKRLKQKL